MKFKFKTIIALSFSIIAVMLAATAVHAEINLPSSVRIGLYFKDAYSGGHSQTSCFNISAVKGLDLGYYASSKFSVLFNHNYSSIVTVRKDGYFVKNSTTFTEFNPSGTIPSGTRLGPYHVQIGGSYSSYSTAKTQVVALKADKNIIAFPAYDDGWFVWTGNFTTQNRALTEMISNITSKYPQLQCKLINEEKTRVVVTLSGNTLFMFDSATKFFQIRPKSTNAPLIFKLNSQRYRGNLEVRRLSNSDMTLINVIKLDYYLYGVVPSEMPAYSHIEALKAQAVVARTYTYNSLKRHSSMCFNLCPTVHCQAYLGYDNEDSRTNIPVNNTNGKIVTYQGNSAQVFYFGSSGGRTEDVKNVWGNSIPYLISVDDPYESSDFAWTETRTPKDIKEKMVSWGYNLGDVKSVKVTKRSAAGRAIEMIISCTSGNRTFKNEQCRTILGLKSQQFTISSPQNTYFRASDGNVAIRTFGGMTVVSSGGTQKIASSRTITMMNSAGTKKSVSAKPGVYTIKGRGAGHAVGMSQEGAMGMGKKGFTYTKILTHYFPGTSVQ